MLCELIFYPLNHSEITIDPRDFFKWKKNWIISTFQLLIMTWNQLKYLGLFIPFLRRDTVKGEVKMNKFSDDINHIYQPLRSGKIWHKVNF